MSLDLSYIFSTFRKLDNIDDKIAYLRELSNMNLPYDINYENLISAWEKIGAKQ